MNPYKKNQIKQYLTKYLNKQFGIEIKNSKNKFGCPICKSEETAVIYPNNITKYHCYHPKCNFKGDIFDLIRKTKNPKMTDEDIADFLNQKLEITIQDELKDIFDMYVKNGFCLFPIAKGTKIPTIKEWQNSEHKNPDEWMEWINENQDLGLNIGKSNICIVDIG
ncbi:MAG: bifunctional DNA primase/polymerase [Nanoarchaeota archaeon]|nr:bifunctional DNA primase/polymerase [Nanoarchaeota archaeon]